jgi:hypothetical protein
VICRSRNRVSIAGFDEEIVRNTTGIDDDSALEWKDSMERRFRRIQLIVLLDFRVDGYVNDGPYGSQSE